MKESAIICKVLGTKISNSGFDCRPVIWSLQYSLLDSVQNLPNSNRYESTIRRVANGSVR